MTGANGLVVDVDYRRGQFTLAAALHVPRGTITGLIGPNGAGKTTLLDLVSGLLAPERGTIGFDQVVWDDQTTRLPTHRRRIGRVFADLLLFEHLDVRGNLAFGLPRPERAASLDHWLERLELTALRARKPAQLSHGQAQRVALGRALATMPDLLVLDEPLAALDAEVRMRMRTLVRDHVRASRAAALLVTHDPLDAMLCADRLIVLEAGRIAQQGSPIDVARTPRSEYVASLMGLNLAQGVQAGHRLSVSDGVVLTTARSGAGPAAAAFPPSAVALYAQQPAGSPRNVWLGRVATIEPRGEVARVRVDAEPPGLPSVLADVTAAAVAELGLGVDRSVWVAVKATEIHSYPR